MKIQLVVAVLILVALTASYYLGKELKANIQGNKENVQLSSVPAISLFASFYCNPQHNCTQAEVHQLTYSCEDSIDSMRACTERFSKNDNMKTKCLAYVDAVKELDSAQRNSNEILLYLDSLAGALTKQETTYFGYSGIGLTPWKEKLSIVASKLDPCLDAVAIYQNSTRAANQTS